MSDTIGILEKERKETERKVYAVGRHDRSLCHQKQPEILSLLPLTSSLTMPSVNDQLVSNK